MAIFGWIVLLLLTLYASLVFLLICTQTLGSYNIGGVPTTLKGKVLTLIAGAALVWWWFKVFEWAPFIVGLAP